MSFSLIKYIDIAVKESDIQIPGILLMLTKGPSSIKELAKFIYILDRSRKNPERDLPVLENMVKSILENVLCDYVENREGKYQLLVDEKERIDIQSAIFNKTVDGFFAKI